MGIYIIADLFMQINEAVGIASFFRNGGLIICQQKKTYKMQNLLSV